MGNFDIFDVADVLGLSILESGAPKKTHPNISASSARDMSMYQKEVYAVCPFCGDARGKFSMTASEKSGAYHCFCCDAHGNAFTLAGELANENFGTGSERYKNIARFINKKLGNTDFAPRKVPSPAPKKKDIKKSDEECSKVYYELLRHLLLRSGHRKDLHRRGFTDEDIKRFRFRSMPTNPKRVCAELIEAGCDLYGIPGFYKKDGEWTMAYASGYLCPVFNKNLIIGFQIRSDKPMNGAKYVWLSSDGKECGCGSGSQCSYLPSVDPDAPVIVTEGTLKSLAIYVLFEKKVTVIGVPGIKVTKNLTKVFPKGARLCFEAFDMDKIPTDEIIELKKDAEAKGIKITARNRKYHEVFKQESILRAAAELRSKLKVEFNADTHSLSWDATDKLSGRVWNGKYKGLDDFLYASSATIKRKFIEYLKKTEKGYNEAMALRSPNPTS